MNIFAKKIQLVDIEEELKNSYLSYAMSVIIGRALPDVRDGLKPVHRRILFAMKILGNDWNKPYKKSARIVGDVIGKYHPHGDSAVYETIVRMAQEFSMRYMLIDGQGNFGSIDGDSAAAMRYTEIRMSKIAHELLEDIDKNTVEFVLNYDGTENVPNVFPAKIPNLLINGSSGIAVGMATNIPPHNLTEVIDACLAYIKDPHISIEKIMQYLPGPDFPTGGIINGSDGIKEAYETGKGIIYIKSKSTINVDNKTNREIIIISEIPYQVNKSRLIEKIYELIKDKKIDGIHSLRDESDQDGIRIVIEIKRDFIANIILNQLYSLTQLQISFGINMVALSQNQPNIMPLKKILLSFINHRRHVVTLRTKHDLEKAQDKAHLLESLMIAFKNIEKIIPLIRKSSSLLEIKSQLSHCQWDIDPIFLQFKENIKKSHVCFLKNYNNIQNNQYILTELQINAILNLRLHKLTNLEFNNLLEEYKTLLAQISNFLKILNDPQYLTQIIHDELVLIKTKYTDNRKTTILNIYENIKIEDLINKENVVITLSHKGYVKYQPVADYEAQRRGGKGKSAANIKDEDFIDYLLVANTHDTILLFSSKGKMYWLKVYQLPESTRGSCGKPIINLLPLESNKERITAILAMNNNQMNKNIFMVTSYGIVKKIRLKEIKKSRNTGIIAINLNYGDELIGVDFTNGNNYIMLFSAYGKVVKFPENQVRNMKRNAAGVKGIDLIKGDKVVSLIVPNEEGPILTVTKNGYGKLTSQLVYPVKSRATKGVISIKITNRNGEVVSSMQVHSNDQIMLITNAGTLVRIRVSEINIVGRNTQGVMLIRTVKNEQVVGVQKIS